MSNPSTQKIDSEQGECVHCKKTFHKKRYWQKFCSSTCRAGYHSTQLKRAYEIMKEQEQS